MNEVRSLIQQDEMALKVCAYMRIHLEQARAIHGAMAMKDYELAMMSLDDLLQPAIEKRLQQMTPEQRVAGLTPEQLAEVVTPEQLVRSLTPEQFAKVVTPEQLAKSLTPDQLTEMIEALPPEVREQVKRRLH